MATETTDTTDDGEPSSLETRLHNRDGQRFNKTPAAADLARVFGFPKHARPLPVSRNYFGRTPNFSDRFVAIYKLSVAYAHLPLISPSDAERVTWKNLTDVKQSFAEPVKATDYARCLHLIKELHRIHPALRPAEVTEALKDFQRDTQANRNVARPIPIDVHGRSIGVGRRKSSTARAFLVEGDGQVLVNGKSLADYFGRVHDRESAIWPLHSTDRINKYNVWARVEGGGTTGQAEALTLAIAKALITHEPGLKPALRRGEFPSPPSNPLIRHKLASKHDMEEPPQTNPSSPPSRHRHTRPEESGEEEARPRQGEKDAYLGQEIKSVWVGGPGWACCHHHYYHYHAVVGWLPPRLAGVLRRICMMGPADLPLVCWDDRPAGCCLLASSFTQPCLCKPFSVSNRTTDNLYNTTKQSKKSGHGPFVSLHDSRPRLQPPPPPSPSTPRNGRAVALLTAVAPPPKLPDLREAAVWRSGIKRLLSPGLSSLGWIGWVLVWGRVVSGGPSGRRSKRMMRRRSELLVCVRPDDLRVLSALLYSAVLCSAGGYIVRAAMRPRPAPAVPRPLLPPGPASPPHPLPGRWAG